MGEAEKQSALADAKVQAQERDPRFVAAKRAGNGEVGRELLEHAAMGASLTEVEERSALDWLLGDPVPIEHEIPVQFETPEGMRELRFIVPVIDARRIDAIERAHLDTSTGRLNRLSADFEIIAECARGVTDKTGQIVSLTDERFRKLRMLNQQSGDVENVTHASAAIALERRFRGQEGLATFISMEIRRLCGYDPERVGQARRRLVEASLG